MKKMTLTMVALLSMTAMQAQDNNNVQTQEQTAKTLILPEGQRPKIMDLNGTPELRTERMSKELSLTDEQKTKVLELNKVYQDVLAQEPRQGNMRPRRQQQPDAETGATEQQKRERPQLTDEQKAEMKQKMEKRKAYNDQLKKILTAEQYEKYQKSQMRHAPRRGHGGPRKQGGPRGPRPEKTTNK